MKLGIVFYRFGILGFLFAPGVLLQEPLKSLLAQNHAALLSYVLLYGLPVLVGFTMLMMTEEGFRNPPAPMERLMNGISAVTVFWLILWCVIWSGLDSNGINQADYFIRYLIVVGPLGALIGAVIYGWAWKIKVPAEKIPFFLMAIGWNICFMSFMNLHLEPSMGHLKGPGVGGLLVMGGAYLILGDLRRNPQK